MIYISTYRDDMVQLFQEPTQENAHNSVDTIYIDNLKEKEIELQLQP